jgi:hypothetical protein
MKRTTIFVPEALERDLQLYARQQGKPMAFVVREAVEAYLVAHRPATRLPSFAGIGASDRADTAETHEALLFRDLDPHQTVAASTGSTYARPRRAASPRRRRKGSTRRS